jgi:crotonobetainyl-CoA:carnitine CoA-transferase CaiB-like acyl-CoA transferase
VPYQSFAAADGYFILGCGNDGLWRRFCTAIQRTDLMEDPRFKTNTDRVKHRAECVEILSDIFGTRNVAEWVEAISQAGVPCGPINRVSDVVNDLQVRARHMMVDIPHPRVPDLRMPGSPLMLTDTPSVVRHPPPLLGQHNKEILTELGYSTEQIAKLKQKGIIGS